jgi:hypothetical protein
MHTQTQLTIYALADNSTLTEDVYTSTRAKQLHIRLTDAHNKTLVQTAVTSVREALDALKTHTVNDVHVSYNTDCTAKIYRLATSINAHFLA